MGATNVYGARRKVFVTPFAGQTIKYGFGTNIDAAESTELGQVALTSSSGVVVFGCDSPKPGRAKRFGTSGAIYTVTSFIDAAKSAAMPTGWMVIKQPKAKGAANGAKTKAVFVAFSGYKYAWMMPTRLYTALAGDKTALGIEDCDAGDYREYIWGSNSFKPPKAAKTVPGSGGGIDTYSTFYDPDKTLPEGWVKISDSIVAG